MKVLYATDGFPAAIAAGRVISSLFRRNGVTITVASVTDVGTLDPGHIVLELDPVRERRLDSQTIVLTAQARLLAEGFDASSLVLEGHPGSELLKEITHGDYDVVVMGSGSHSWVGNHLLGSVSTRLLHEAPCSVLVTHDFRETEDVREALVAVDGSHTANETVVALSHILDPDRVQVEVLSVVDVHIPVAVPVLVGVNYPSHEMTSRIDDELTVQAEGHARIAKQTLQDAGFQVTSRAERGGASTVILEEASHGGADLVAVGSRGLGPIRRVLLGSVSDQVVRHVSAAFVGGFTRGKRQGPTASSAK